MEKYDPPIFDDIKINVPILSEEEILLLKHNKNEKLSEEEQQKIIDVINRQIIDFENIMRELKTKYISRMLEDLDKIIIKEKQKDKAWEDLGDNLRGDC